MTPRAEFALAFIAALAALTIAGNEVVPAFVVGGTVIVCVAVIIWGRLVTRVGRSGGPPPWLPAAFAACWLVLIVAGGHAIGASSARTETIGIIGLSAVFYFAVIAAFGILVVRAFVDDVKDTVVPAALLGLPVLAVLSFLWSPDLFHSFGRGFQLLATAVFAWATIELGARSPQFLEAMVECVLRWLVWVAAVLVGLGVAFGGIYAPVGVPNLDRFHWIGAHPNFAGAVTGMALVALVGAPTTALRLPLIGRVAMMGIIGYGAWGAQARTSLVALGAGLGVCVVLYAMRSSMARYVSLPYVLAAVFTLAFIFRDQALGYFYRDQNSDTVTSGNGRVELWGDTFRHLRTSFDWLFGLGYGQSDTVFLAERAWATNAHSSVLGILVNLGIVGVALLAFWLFYTLVVLYQSQVFLTPLGGTLLAFQAFVIVHSVAAESASRPAGGHALMMLVGAVSAAVVRLNRGGVPTALAPPHARAEEGQEELPAPGESSDAPMESDTSVEPVQRPRESADLGLRVWLRVGAGQPGQPRRTS